MQGNRDFETWCSRQRDGVAQALEAWLPASGGGASRLSAAMRYSAQRSEDRLHALLVMAASEAAGSSQPAALGAAAAVELIHACGVARMEMPFLRARDASRVDPSVHARYGEGVAVLAGDANLSLAFEILTDGNVVPWVLQGRLCALLARASGHAGAVGGQADQTSSDDAGFELAGLRDMHCRTTGALMMASVLMGAACGDTTLRTRSALREYASALAFGWHVARDVELASRPPGDLSRAVLDAPVTYVSLMGMDKAQAHARKLHAKAEWALARSGLTEVTRLRQINTMIGQHALARPDACACRTPAIRAAETLVAEEPR